MSAGVTKTASFDLRRMKSSYGKVKITKVLYKGVALLWRDSAREFVRVASEHIAVDTGMSRASLIPIARMLKMQLAVQGRRTRRGVTHLVDGRGEYDPSGVRGTKAGISAGSHAFEYKLGSQKRMHLTFEFDISVWQHFMYEDGFNGKAPWDSLEAGRKAFNDFFDSNWDTYVKQKVAVSRFSLHVG